MQSRSKLLVLPLTFIIVGIIAYQPIINIVRPSSTPQYDEVITSDANDNESICEQLLRDRDRLSVDRYEGAPKPVNFNTWPEAEKYTTVINQAVSSGPNFAGHFTLASWGCGTDCFGYALVDTVTGNIVTYSPVHESYHLGDCSIDSQILVFVPVYSGQERKFYELQEKDDGEYTLELICTEISTENMY